MRNHSAAVLLVLACVAIGPAPLGRAATYTLNATNLVAGPNAQANSVALTASPATAPWTAAANDSWLHLSCTNGTGSTNVVFSLDTNKGATRTGTVTIAGQTLTIIQAGAGYVAANSPTPLVSAGLNCPAGVAVDGSGNVYIADKNNGAIRKWAPATGTLTTLLSSGVGYPYGLAVDGSGNVYIADPSDNAIKKWTAANGTLSTLVSTGLSSPEGVAVDDAGNVYIADTGNCAIKKWTAASSTVSTLVSSGLSYPQGVAVDIWGNVYVADTSNYAVKKWNAADGTVTTLVSAGLGKPYGVALDSAGNVYIADTESGAIRKWKVADGTLTTLVSSGLSWPCGVAVDGAGAVYIADTGHNAIQELPCAFVDTTAKVEPPDGGSDALPAVVPCGLDLSGPFAPVSDQPWLTITGVTNGVVSFAFAANADDRRSATISLVGRKIAIQQGARFTLALTNMVEGPGAGVDTFMLAASSPTNLWTNTANAPWLHVGTVSGAGGATLVVSYDANSGPTRTGTLTIAGKTLTVTQAGRTYVGASPLTVIVAGICAESIAVDGAGNVFIADTSNNAIRRWNAADRTLTTLVSSGLYGPSGVALDNAGNVYISDTRNDAIKMWHASDGSVSTVARSLPAILFPEGIAVDGAGNVYFTMGPDGIGLYPLKKWNASNKTLTTLVPSGLYNALGLSIDVSGNLYIADQCNNALKKWNVANNTLTTLFWSDMYAYGLSGPSGVAVDGSGNVLIADTCNHAIKRWNALDGSVSNLRVEGLEYPMNVASDLWRNVYIADTYHGLIKEIPRAFVDPTPKTLPAGAGSDTLPPVLPLTSDLAGPFAPASDQPWLTILGVTNGAVTFGFSANMDLNAVSRSAHITLLGQIITLTQPAPILGTTNLVEGPAAGADGVTLTLSPATANWTNTANDPWLHPTTSGGAGSTNVFFSFDANPGLTRTGTLTVAGQTLTIIQAGAGYVAANSPTPLVSAGLNCPAGVAVDGSGNVYIADKDNGAIRKWAPATGTLTTLLSSGVGYPYGLAVDGSGNVYIADPSDNAIKKWTAANGTLSTLVSTGLSSPEGVAVDDAGNVYIADTGNMAVRKWFSASGAMATLVASGLSYPHGVAVDRSGNVYIADTSNYAIKKWNAADGTVTTLVSAGFGKPYGVALDGAGNVYVADTENSAIRRWNVADGTLTTLVSSGLSWPGGVAVDRAGNVFIADTGNQAIKELPRAFLDPTARAESPNGGSDALPAVVPCGLDLAGPFAPVSDQSWLTITGVTNGVVSFDFATNTGLNRSASITLLGRTVAVTQAGVIGTPPTLAGAQITNGMFQFTFSNDTAGASFSILSSTNLAVALSNWTVISVATNTPAGWFEFTDTNTFDSQRFYRVRAP